VATSNDGVVSETMSPDLPPIIATLDGPMAFGSSAVLLRTLLDEYQCELVKRGVPVDRWLAPGTSPERIRTALSEVGLAANDEVVTWFSWHDGVAEDVEFRVAAHAMPNFVAAPLSYAIQRYRDSVLEFELPYGTDVPWDYFMFGAGEGWLRLIDDNRGCAIDCSGTREQGRPPIIRSATESFGMPGNEKFFQAVSLCTLVTWWLESLRTGGFHWNSGAQQWDIDDSALPALQLLIHFD
jgi:hypothetical protein